MTKDELVKEYVEPWIDPAFLRNAIGEIAYEGMLKDLVTKMNELEEERLKA